MFQRRNPLPWAKRIAQILWPKQGWRRAGSYVAHRLRRLPGTPYRIAAGFASGAAVSFTPFLGLHFLLAAVLALALRGNLMAAAIGTVVGNPWTFPLIWAWIYNLGTWIMGGNGTADDFSVTYLLQHPTFIFENFRRLFIPMVIGAVPTAVVAWFLCFWPLRRMVDRYQTARLRRLQKKMERKRRKQAATAAALPYDHVAETRR